MAVKNRLLTLSCKFIDSNGKEVMVPDHMNGHPKGNVPPHFNDTIGGHHIYKPEGC